MGKGGSLASMPFHRSSGKALWRRVSVTSCGIGGVPSPREYCCAAGQWSGPFYSGAELLELSRALVGVVERYGLSRYLRTDNGTEFTARRMQEWLAARHIQSALIDPGKPWQNGVVESFHSRLRDEWPEPGVIRQSRGGAGRDRAVPALVQRNAFAQQPGLPNPR